MRELDSLVNDCFFFNLRLVVIEAFLSYLRLTVTWFAATLL